MIINTKMMMMMMMMINRVCRWYRERGRGRERDGALVGLIDGRSYPLEK